MKEPVVKQLAAVAGALGYTESGVMHPRPKPESIVELLEDLRAILFPGYFRPSRDGRHVVCMLEHLGVVYWRLAGQIHNSLHNTCVPNCAPHTVPCPLMEQSCRLSAQYLDLLPMIQARLRKDVQAAYDGDPAATGQEEVILAYPGVYAVTVYRLAHEFYRMNLSLIARIMSEYAHSTTGIDIHPGAQIGDSFFIDHGTGVVIGETCVIGDRVKIYQGVTLGALSFPKDDKGALIRNHRRHPTIGDDVTIYAGATILGGDTSVGHDSVIGGNVWITNSLSPYSKVVNRPQIETRSAPNGENKG